MRLSWYRKGFLAAAGGLWVGCLIGAPEPARPELTVCPCEASPVIDGKLDDACWTNAARLAAFHHVPAGRGLWASMFGAKLEYRKPGGVWIIPPEGVTTDKLIDQGVPDVSTAGIAPLVLDVSHFFLDKTAQFKNLSKLYTIAIEPDGIFEVLMSLLGQKILEDMLLRPEIAKNLFDIVQETQFRYCSLIQKTI